MARPEVAKLLRRLKKHYPDSRCSLNFKSPHQLMVATILSAQCTDERVNKVTPALFKKYPNVEAFADAKLSDLEKLVQSTGFYKNKARSILDSSRELVKRHDGRVPETMEELTPLRGIGRKTANVILGTAFGKAVGVVVDTHVGRISRRLGLTSQTDPVKVERDLMKVLPKRDWTIFSHLMIDHGRAICLARRADCEHCFLSDLCPKKGVAPRKKGKK